MELNLILNATNQISDLSEKYFLELGSLFPSLLNRDGSSSLNNLQTVVKKLKESNEASSASERSLFEGYGDKYNPLFDRLNEKIQTLSELDKLIADIKEDSEQMELIALNAMVISIKSGEKGLAFSKITENLQRLSKEMFQFSDQLLTEEKQLIEHINTLKEIFSNIIGAQKELSSQGYAGSNDINSIITSIAAPLEKIKTDASMIYPPIQRAKENLQLQDIIRQALDHIKRCLKEISESQPQIFGSDEELDSTCFNIALYELSDRVLQDIIENVTKGFTNFQQNWNEVSQRLESIEKQKNEFSARFLDEKTSSHENITVMLKNIILQFKKMMEGFNQYNAVQKDLIHTTQSINERARTMYKVFGNLRPVMASLHHVRILQQMEVAKNEAIMQVKDSVTDMDNLIQFANTSLDTMEQLLSQFIKDTTDLLLNFTSSLSEDNQKMGELSKEKGRFFEELQNTQNNISVIIYNFEVFPTDFEKKCELVAKDISNLSGLNSKLQEFQTELSSKKEKLSSLKEKLLAQKKLDAWIIKNSKFKEIIERFTIASHKEATGEIAGFKIEGGSAAGEVTLF